MGTWNWLDYILAAIVLASVVTAMMKGFVQELISLASVVIGLVVAAMGYPRAALWFDDLTKSHEIALGLGFLVLFLATLLVGALVGVLARKLIKTAGIQWFDRFLGGIFGLVRGIMIDAILLMALMAFAIKPDAVRQATLAPYVTTGTRVISLVMPGNLRAQFRLGFEKFREALVQSDKGKIKP
jgi:membrane protein required for colicin V production